MLFRSKIFVLFSAVLLLSACEKKVSFQNEVEQTVKSYLYDQVVAHRARPEPGSFFWRGPMSAPEKEQLMFDLDQKKHLTDITCVDLPGSVKAYKCTGMLADDTDRNIKLAFQAGLVREGNGKLTVIHWDVRHIGF